MKRVLLALATGAVLSAAFAPARAAGCTGDCSRNGRVSVDELIVGVGIALGRMSIDRCPDFDREADGAVTVDDLLAGVGSNLNGCPAASPTASTTTSPTATPTPTRVNQAPLVETQPVYRSFPGFPIELPVRATDPDGDPLRFSAARLPPGAQLDDLTGVLRWEPDEEALGPQCVPFTVLDEGSPPLSAAGRFLLHVAPLDPCAVPSCEPAAGCTETVRPLAEGCCAKGPVARSAEPLFECPEGRILLIGRNAAGFGPLESCDVLRVENFAQIGAIVRFHLAVRCLNAAEQVHVRARLEILERRDNRPGLIFDEQDDVFLDREEDGFARVFDVAFPVIGPGPFFEFEGAEALLHVSLTDVDGVTVRRDLRLVLTFERLSDLPDPHPPTADEVCGSPTRTPTETRTPRVTATRSNTPRPPLPTATASRTVSPSPSATPIETFIGEGTPTSATETPTATPTAATPGPGGWTFTDQTLQAGLDYTHGYSTNAFFQAEITAGGVGAGDYDDDGWVDLYVVRGDIGANLLFRNRGDGTFEEIAAAAGVALKGARGSGPTFADYDGDGAIDLLVLGISGTHPTLFRNRGDGTFEDVTAASAISTTFDSYSSAFGDYDRDGDLDLFITHWARLLDAGPAEELLWRNDGDGTFTDVSIASQVSAATGGTVADSLYDLTFTPNFADVDGDGWPDLLLACDFGTSRVLLNNRDGTFRNATTSAISDENGKGGAVGDYDNDGDLDWFVSSVFDPNGVPEGYWSISGNRLYRNAGKGVFEDATDEAGVRFGFWGWAATFADFDNDGNLDIFHVNGWGVGDTSTAEYDDDPSRLFVARGDGKFSERSFELGLVDPGQGRGAVAFDYDRDGDLDLFIANNEQAPRLWRNDGGNARSHLRVRLRGAPPNTQAIGARVFVTIGDRTQMRELRAGSNFESQDPAEAHFGLGDAKIVDELRVAWPDGVSTELAGVAAGSDLVLDHPRRARGGPWRLALHRAVRLW